MSANKAYRLPATIRAMHCGGNKLFNKDTVSPMRQQRAALHEYRLYNSSRISITSAKGDVYV